MRLWWTLARRWQEGLLHVLGPLQGEGGERWRQGMLVSIGGVGQLMRTWALRGKDWV